MVSETNTIDWNATAAWIALAVSIITPAISLLLNNIHQRKLKETELKNALIIKQYDEMKNVIMTLDWEKSVEKLEKIFSQQEG